MATKNDNDDGVKLEIRHGGNLSGIARCPHCGVAKPVLHQLWRSDVVFIPGESAYGRVWGTYRCTSCGQVVLARGYHAEHGHQGRIENIYPDIIRVDDAIPLTAKRFLEQAFETLHAPDAAAVMAGSAVDAMLKQKGYAEGSLYARIDQAVKDNILTKEMGEWAHQVRLGSNRPRHADADNPHVAPEQAKQSVEFANALAQFLFVLTARIQKGIEFAKSAG